ncbi:MAG: nucleotidyltransferase domain-containing protein [Candidatus Thorarchaeota archaeon]|nr:nucleotidyltransferase domain-containing protein [Candidatus Thorarchaeota archaeon]
MDIDRVRRELAFLADRDVLVYGSFLTQAYRAESDIDIALIAHTKDVDEIIRLRIETMSQAPEYYDIQVFEALPTLIQGSILANYEVLFGDPPSIGEYLRRYLKEWDNYTHRLELPSMDEIRRGLAGSDLT